MGTRESGKATNLRYHGNDLCCVMMPPSFKSRTIQDPTSCIVLMRSSRFATIPTIQLSIPAYALRRRRPRNTGSAKQARAGSNRFVRCVRTTISPPIIKLAAITANCTDFVFLIASEVNKKTAKTRRGLLQLHPTGNDLPHQTIIKRFFS